MLSTSFNRESDFPFRDVLAALPTGAAAWRAHKRLMLVTSATAYLSGATLLLSFIN